MLADCITSRPAQFLNALEYPLEVSFTQTPPQWTPPIGSGSEDPPFETDEKQIQRILEEHNAMKECIKMER